jgi:glucokinase
MIVLGGSVMKSVPLEDLRGVISQGCRFVPWQKTELALASLGQDANLIGAARVWHSRFASQVSGIA